MAIDYTCRMPAPGTPLVDPQTGIMSVAMWHWMLSMFTRTGYADPGIGTVDAEALAAAAQAAATAASGAVVTEAGIRAAADSAEATTRAAADTTLTTDLATETAARIAAIAAEAAIRAAADLLLAPKANPVFTGTVETPIFTDAANDAAAAAAGVVIGELYRSSSSALPTSPVGLGPGSYWSNAGVVMVTAGTPAAGSIVMLRTV